MKNYGGGFIIISTNTRLFAVVQLFALAWLSFAGFVYCQKPTSVRIGAVFTFNSVVGKVAKAAIEAAVSDVNEDPRILNGTKLKLVEEDTNSSVFLGSVGAFQVLEEGVVAIIGPQSSSMAHMISEIANGLQVPLISYAASDPTLSALQFPFFVRTTQSDAYQMAAMANLIEFYGWKEVIVIYEDDDHGRNGIFAFEDELEKNRLRMAYKLPLSIQLNPSEITDVLNKSKLLGPRVYVVHVNPDPSLRVFAIAQKLQMMTSDYVWFATDWLSSTIDSLSPINPTSLGVLQGVVVLRQHIPDSSQKRAFVSRWKRMLQKGSVSSGLNTYGLYAYDTVWTAANAIDNFIKESGNMSFSYNEKLVETNDSEIQLGKLKVFDGGSLLLRKLLESNFNGLTGHVRFDQDRNIIGGGYEVINIDKMIIHTVGFWTNNTGFSVSAPETLKGKKQSYSPLDQKLLNVTWPGGKVEKPRGWVIANNDKPLRIGVPKRASFIEFVTEYSNHTFQGYCIDVFLEARKLVPYDIPYKFVSFGDGRSNPNYDQFVKMVADNVFDAAVGDIAIVKNRTMIADFSQPYISTGLVIVAPTNNAKPSAWVFLRPFTLEMWCVTAASFVVIAVVIWILEHRVNDDFRGPPKRQLITMFLFSFSTLFKRNQENTVSPLGRMVMVVWLFILMVITSSYTASLSSILTVQQLSSPITGLDSLIASNLPIGYQTGSFTYNYLVENLFISRSRLVSLGSPEEFEKALQQGPSGGGVAAIIDELPYVNAFLSKHTDFGIIGQPFTRGGWGFAFQRGSPLAVDISTAILKLSETGQLQNIQTKWFCEMGCPDKVTSDSDTNQLRLISFWGLYLLCGAFSLVAFIIFLLRMVYLFVRYKRQQVHHPQVNESPALPTVLSSGQCSEALFNFIDFVDKKEEAIKKMFSNSEGPQVQAAQADKSVNVSSRAQNDKP
ncbi:glutamate receptor 3.7 [Ziziphus jujuba]|uniref:Glutamate receptor n=1 Tax=Ziziphus jujuba TaxID=326968 RepID=A0ABM4A6J6_ZIZJJ|nr:glutamate receptor 3.7 [Ziziphus jujuba]XP_060672356.1 glutamate receptor 3.7 [Ziziphus jujuba]